MYTDGEESEREEEGSGGRVREGAEGMRGGRREA